jgi:hypothetical protein
VAEGWAVVAKVAEGLVAEPLKKEGVVSAGEAW